MKFNWNREAQQDGGDEALRRSLADIASEAWRLDRVIDKTLLRMDPMDAQRFLGQYRWFRRKVDDALSKADMLLVDLTGQEYSVGMAASPLNIDEFDEDDLEVEQMVEPIIMSRGTVIKTGSVMLRPKKS